MEFELIKENVRDVVVELKYSDRIDEKNIHLKQEDPYISVVSARRYKEGDRRRLEVVVTYGAVKGEAEEIDTSTAQELNNIYVSIKDDTESIIGFPYEYRIPTLKDGQEKTLDFELRRNVDSLTVNLKYLDTDHPYNIHLEEDTRPHLHPECEEISRCQQYGRANDGDNPTEKHLHNRGNAERCDSRRNRRGE